jgi:hypothetical protein
MHRPSRLRPGRPTAAAVAGVLVLAAAFALPAAAATVKTACSSVTITTKGTGTLKKCTNLKGTGGSGKLVVNTSKSPYVATFTWNKTGKTKAKLTYAPAPANAKKVCPTDKIEIDVSGTVTGGTGAAIRSIKKGSKVSAKLCYKGTTLTLAPKTTFKL